MGILSRLSKVPLYARRRLIDNRRQGIYYLVPEAGWSIDWDGHYITRGVQRQFGVKAQLSSNPRWLEGQILHYGSLWSLVGSLQAEHNQANDVVATVFHGDRDKPAFKEPIDQLLAQQDMLAKLVTSNTLMAQRFRQWGMAADKIACIPLGVDLGHFRPPSPDQRARTRQELGIPGDAYCIGSFQKDGNGWDEGLEPKLIKGPDVFLEALEALKGQHADLFVLLSAPARGYVKEGLRALDIPFRHIVLDDYLEIARLYWALDLYLVTSREEGGPKGPLEAMASGVPVVTTRVGMTPDLITPGQDGFLAEQEDAQALAGYAGRLIEEPGLAREIAEQALDTIQDYDWDKIAARYYHQVYAPLLAS